ncbi:hypothetical protein VTO42DRAFT_7005 [Malbranchea cinnamomea]
MKIQERGTYIEATLPLKHHATPLMWVFDYKFDDNGYLLNHKTYLVVRGDLVPANDMNEIIYYFFPDGFKQPGKVMRLLHALYGLPRSPYLWFRELTETFEGLGFKAVLENVCLLTNGCIIIFFYVDDIVIMNRPEHRSEANEVVLKLKAKYEIHDLGDLQWFLNITISRDPARRHLFDSGRLY